MPEKPAEGRRHVDRLPTTLEQVGATQRSCWSSSYPALSPFRALSLVAPTRGKITSSCDRGKRQTNEIRHADTAVGLLARTRPSGPTYQVHLLGQLTRVLGITAAHPLFLRRRRLGFLFRKGWLVRAGGRDLILLFFLQTARLLILGLSPLLRLPLPLGERVSGFGHRRFAFPGWRRGELLPCPHRDPRHVRGHSPPGEWKRKNLE